MLTILLKILSILGILLLVLLCIFLALLLLVLFFPITYKACGNRKILKQQADMKAELKAKWLFGLLRVVYGYPNPGKIIAKVLWFTVYDSSKPSAEKQDKGTAEGTPNADNAANADSTSTANTGNTESADSAANTDNTANVDNTANAESADPGDNTSTANAGSTANANDTSNAENPDAAAQTLKNRILVRIEKIKYTFLNIYDKIKHIWENISYYKALLEDEDTRLLFSHASTRVGRILQSVRPRKIKADILFGTGSPDTTGYVYGVYGMLLPKLGPKVLVTPDFTQAILEGEISLAGHITVFQVLRHAIILLLDKRLRLFINRLKAGRNENGR